VRPPYGSGTTALVAVPVAVADAMAAPAVLVATSTSYAAWGRPPACAYVQAATGIVEVTPAGAVTVTTGKGDAGVKEDVDQTLQYAGVLALT